MHPVRSSSSRPPFLAQYPLAAEPYSSNSNKPGNNKAHPDGKYSYSLIHHLLHADIGVTGLPHRLPPLVKDPPNIKVGATCVYWRQ